MSSDNAARQKGPNALQKIHRKGRQKVVVTQRSEKLLKTFAEDDYKRIAKLIGRWLDEDRGHRRR